MDSIYALNWRIHFIFYSGELTFNEICCLIINKFLDANIIKIVKDKEVIKIQFPTPYLYIDVLRKIDRCRNQVIIDIDLEEEYKLLSPSQSVNLHSAENNVEDDVIV